MIFNDIDDDTCMPTLAAEVAKELSDHINKLYDSQATCHQEGHSVANVVLAGLTLAWLDAVHNCWNTMPCESAMSVLRAIGPEDRSTKRDYKLAARDFLRRSGWWINRRRMR